MDAMTEHADATDFLEVDDAPTAVFTTVTIEVRGKRLPFQIKVLDVNEYTEYELGWEKLTRLGQRDRPIRMTEEEQATVPVVIDGVPQYERDGTTPLQAFVISDDVLSRQRLEQMTVEDMDRHEARRQAGDRWASNYTKGVIRKYVTLAEGHVRTKGGIAVTTGDQIVETFRTNKVLLSRLVWEIWLQNNLTEAQKKTFGSLLDSVTSSSASALESPRPSGPGPATVAASAAPSASAKSGAASSQETTSQQSETSRSSGTAGTSSSPAAPSGA